MRNHYRSPSLNLLCLLVWLCFGVVAVDAAVRVTVQDTVGKPLEQFEAHWIYKHRALKLESTGGGALSIPSAGGVVVARAAGYQCAGIAIDGESAAEIAIIMRGESEQGARAYRTRTLGIVPELSQRLLQQLEEKCWASLKQSVNPTEAAFTLQLLGQIAPKKTLQYLQGNPVDQNAAGMARQSAIRVLATRDFAAAVEVLDSFNEPMFRSFLLSQLVDALPRNHESLEVIESQWADTIREIDEPAMRLTSWAMLGEHYLASDRPAMASTIAQQQMKEVRKLPSGGWSGFPRSLFGALIVNDDPELAAELVKGIDKNEEARALGRLAFHACQKNPATAVSFLKVLDKGNVIGFPHTTRVAYRIANDHPGVGFEITELIEAGRHRAWALGLMSKQLAATDTELAKITFARALAELEKEIQTKSRSYVSPGEVGAGLLPVAELVCPEQLESLIWETIFLTVPRTRWNDGAEAFSVKLENVAAAVARYDEHIARSLVSDSQQSDAATVFVQPIQVKDRAVLNRLALDAASLPAFLDSLEVSSRNYRLLKTLADELHADVEGFWTMISIPELMPWPTERYEEQ